MSNGHILFVDDSFGPKPAPGRCTSLVQDLLSNGYEVFLAATVAEAITAIYSLQFDFALIDLNLSPEDGGAVGSARLISEHVIPNEISYARVTGDPRDVPCDQSGCFIFEKGYDSEELLRQLDYFLNRRWEKPEK